MEDFVDRLDPCCGVPLKRGCKFIAMIDLVNSAGTGLFVAFAFVITLIYGDEIRVAVDKDKTEFPDEAQLYDYMGTGFVRWVLVLALVASILYFLLAQLLLRGTQEKDVSKITKWIHISTVLLCLRAIGLFFGIFIAADSFGIIFFGFVYSLYTAYCLWIVCKFRNELLSDESLILRQWDRNLTTMHKL